MAIYTFSYTDAALAPLAVLMPELRFILSEESIAVTGQLISDRPVLGTLFSDGTGYVDLVPNEAIIGVTHYRVQGTYLDSGGTPVGMDLFTFTAREGGGPISEMINPGTYNPAIWWVDTEEPPSKNVIWLNPVTGDIKEWE